MRTRAFPTSERDGASLFRKAGRRKTLLFFLSGLALIVLSLGAAVEEKGSADRGKDIFNDKCTPCHTICRGKSVGPDLVDVTERRPHEWLMNFISNPEEMFKQNDSIATTLLKQYQVPMPNLRLSQQQVLDVFAYIASISGPSSETEGGASDSAGETVATSTPSELGKSIFEENCTLCHTIGGGEKVGPDLKGVTERRPHEWLVNFITDPDKLFNENDPVATQLLKEFNGERMPPSPLTTAQIEDALAFIKSESD
jgi:cytochrome c2